MDLPPLNKFDRFPLIVGLATVFLVLSLALVMAMCSQSFQSAQTSQSAKGETSKCQSAKPATHFLAVEQPEEESVVQNSNLTVAGKTTAGSTVVVIAGENTQLIDVDQTGNFSLNLSLKEGLTTIEITSFGQNGEEGSVSREVFYTTETL